MRISPLWRRCISSLCSGSSCARVKSRLPCGQGKGNSTLSSQTSIHGRHSITGDHRRAMKGQGRRGTRRATHSPDLPIGRAASIRTSAGLSQAAGGCRFRGGLFGLRFGARNEAKRMVCSACGRFFFSSTCTAGARAMRSRDATKSWNSDGAGWAAGSSRRVADKALGIARGLRWHDGMRTVPLQEDSRGLPCQTCARAFHRALHSNLGSGRTLPDWSGCLAGCQHAKHSVLGAVKRRSNELSIYSDGTTRLPGTAVRIRGELLQAELDCHGQVHWHWFAVERRRLIFPLS